MSISQSLHSQTLCNLFFQFVQSRWCSIKLSKIKVCFLLHEALDEGKGGGKFQHHFFILFVFFGVYDKGQNIVILLYVLTLQEKKLLRSLTFGTRGQLVKFTHFIYKIYSLALFDAALVCSYLGCFPTEKNLSNFNFLVLKRRIMVADVVFFLLPLCFFFVSSCFFAYRTYV